MSTSNDSATMDLRARRRLVIRNTISRVANRLFLERGFDHVTVEEIAAGAEVGRMTVFNHFPRKEDMFFDHDEQGRELLRAILRERAPDVSPGEALRRLAHHLVAEGSPYIRFTPGGQRSVETIEASETLKARVRALRDEVAQLIAVVMAEGAGREADDADAHLAADMLLATWSVALIQSHRRYRRDQDAARAAATFLALIDQGTLGVKAAMAGTPFG